MQLIRADEDSDTDPQIGSDLSSKTNKLGRKEQQVNLAHPSLCERREGESLVTDQSVFAKEFDRQQCSTVSIEL